MCVCAWCVGVVIYLLSYGSENVISMCTDPFALEEKRTKERKTKPEKCLFAHKLSLLFCFPFERLFIRVFSVAKNTLACLRKQASLMVA